MTFTIEPMVNAGKRHVRLLRRRLDRRHQGSFAVGAVGAHRAGHRNGFEVLTLGERRPRAPFYR